MGGDFAGMAEEFGEIIEGVRLIELAGVDQAHEHVADAGPILREIEKRILAMADRFFQSPLADVIVQRGSGFVQKERQLLPVSEQIIDGGAQSRVRLDELFVELPMQPTLQFRHRRLAVGLM